LVLSAVLGLISLQGCGGGGGSSESIAPAPPVNPASPDFTFNVQGQVLTMEQQGAPQTIGVAPEGSFTGTVEVTVQSLPTGVSLYPPGPFALGPNDEASIMVIPSSSASLGTSSIVLSGTLGTVTHSATISLTIQPPAPFHLSLSTNAISLTAGAQASFSATATSNSGANLPAVLFDVSPFPTNNSISLFQSPYLTDTPTSSTQPFTITANISATSLQNYPIYATVGSGTDSSTALLYLNVSNTFPSITNPTRSTFDRTDEDVTDAVYDRSRELVFATVNALNEVMVFSSTNARLIARIPVDRPWGIDESADGSSVYVASNGGRLVVIDPDLLQVTQFVPGPTPGGPYTHLAHYAMRSLVALSSGKVLIIGNVDGVSGSILITWDTVSQTMSAPAFAVFQPDFITRSEDHSTALLTSSSGNMLYSAASGTFTTVPSQILIADSQSAVALSPNGSQFAAYDGQQTVTFYDSQFNTLASIVVDGQNDIRQELIYSLDGRFLYDSASFYPTDLTAVSVIDAHTFQPLGVVPDQNLADSNTTIPFDIDETGMIFGGQPQARGLTFLDVSDPGAVSNPEFTLGPSYNAGALLSLSQPEQVSLEGAYFSSAESYRVNFGPPPASPASQIGTGVAVQSANVIHVTAPTGSKPGAANLTVTGSDGWSQLAPDSVSYGPQILVLDGNAGSTSGGSSIFIFGYGLVQPLTETPNTQVTIGGRSATITHSSGPGFLSPFPFAMDYLEVTTPANTSGYADVSVTTPLGSTTLSKGFQYLTNAQVFPLAGTTNQIIYDQGRDRLYVTNTSQNAVDVFSLASMSFLTPIPVGAGPTGIALSPDGAKLAVANFGDGSVSVVDPDQMATIAKFPGVTAGDSGCDPLEVTAVQSQKVLINNYCPGTIPMAGSIHLLDLNSGSLSCVGVAGCTPDGTEIRPQLGSVYEPGYYELSSSKDGTKVAFAISGVTAGLSGILDLTANTITSTDSQGGGATTIDGDGNLFCYEITRSNGFGGFAEFDTQLNEINFPNDIDYLQAGPDSLNLLPGTALNASGSLLYEPQGAPFFPGAAPLSVDVFDVHTGRLALRVAVPDPLIAPLNPMALDETGQRIFLISSTGITIVQLAQEPLSLASANPAAAGPGAQITIRGSGFESGATISFGGALATTTYVDADTLHVNVPAISPGPVRVTVTNPDGGTYPYDALFTVR
jgi:DNA-binding beta-propeller fold protein YncE